MFQPPRDDTRDRTKITDKDSPSNLRYDDVMENKATGVLITKAEQIKATQNLVDKKILGSLVLMGDSGKSNPFRNKSGNKKRKKLERELAKLGDEVLAKIPAEKLAQLLDSELEASDTSVLSDSLREKLKSLVQSAVAKEQTVDDDESKREIVATNPVPGNTATNLLSNNAPSNNTPGSSTPSSSTPSNDSLSNNKPSSSTPGSSTPSNDSLSNNTLSNGTLSNDNALLPLGNTNECQANSLIGSAQA
jgi:hypothetical protein